MNQKRNLAHVRTLSSSIWKDQVRRHNFVEVWEKICKCPEGVFTQYLFEYFEVTALKRNSN